MSGHPTNAPLLPIPAGFCLTLVYVAVGFGAYLTGRPDRERRREAGPTLVRLSPVPSVLELVLAGLAAVSGVGFLLGGVATVPLALCVPVLSVASALDGHAVD